MYVILYDIYNVEQNIWLDSVMLAKQANDISLEVVPVLAINDLNDPNLDPIEVVHHLLDKINNNNLDSCLGGIPEGVVLKCHGYLKTATYLLAKNEIINIKLKYVTSKFKESHQGKKPKEEKKP